MSVSNNFLRLGGIAVALTTLAACGSAQSASTSTSTTTVATVSRPTSTAPTNAAVLPTASVPASSASNAAVSPTAGATATRPAEGTVLTPNAVIHGAAQIPVKLSATSTSFQAAVRRTLVATSGGCGSETRVDRYVVDSWAQGSTGSTCGGGAEAFWYVQNGSWHRIDTQNVLLCTDLEAKGVPAAPPAIDLQCGAMGDTSAIHYAGSGTAGKLQRTPVLGAAPSHSAALTGLGEVRPSSVNFGGDGTSHIDDVTWDDWGGSQANGRGTANWAPPNGPLADAVPVKARVRAFDLGTCNGRTAYRKLAWWWPSKGETFVSAVRRLEGGYSICRGA